MKSEYIELPITYYDLSNDLLQMKWRERKRNLRYIRDYFLPYSSIPFFGSFLLLFLEILFYLSFKESYNKWVALVLMTVLILSIIISFVSYYLDKYGHGLDKELKFIRDARDNMQYVLDHSLNCRYYNNSIVVDYEKDYLVFQKSFPIIKEIHTNIEESRINIYLNDNYEIEIRYLEKYDNHK